MLIHMGFKGYSVLHIKTESLSPVLIHMGCQEIDFLLNCLSAFETRLDLHGCHGQQVINSLSESLRPVLIYAELIIDR